jgi:hypothetical protein
MKNFYSVFVIVTISLFLCKKSDAQYKIGYFSESKTLQLFPESKTADSLLQQFSQDSIGVEYERRANKLRITDSLYKKDCKTALPGKTCEELLNDRDQQRNILVNWFKIGQQMVDAKRAQLYYPLKQQMYEALKEIIAEEKYTTVLTVEALSIYFTPPLLDNLSIRVAMKLHLPLSKQVEAMWKAAEAKAAKPLAVPAKKKTK